MSAKIEMYNNIIFLIKVVKVMAYNLKKQMKVHILVKV